MFVGFSEDRPERSLRRLFFESGDKLTRFARRNLSVQFAVRQQNRPHDLRFPYNNRALIIGWRTLFFNEGEYKYNPQQSAEWNRGAYLVEGLGHCGMCHTPINALGGSSESQAFQGGLIPMQNWYAPSLTSNKEAGLGDWSIEDIVDLLRTGISARGAVYGPMAEVTFNSLQYLNDADVRAMAVYLKSLPPKGEKRPEPKAQLVAPGTMEQGRAIYEAQCAMCHGIDRSGSPPAFPSLAHILDRMPPMEVTDHIKNGKGRMPSFPNLDEQAIKSLLDYLRSNPTAANPTGVAEMKPTLKVLGMADQGPADAAGAKIYADQCAPCHGDHREGNPPSFPILLGLGSRRTAAQVEPGDHGRPA